MLNSSRFDSCAVFDLIIRVQDERRALFDPRQHLGFKLAPVAYFNVTATRYALLDCEHAPAIAPTN